MHVFSVYFFLLSTVIICLNYIDSKRIYLSSVSYSVVFILMFQTKL